MIQEEEFEIDENHFKCTVCGELIEFDADEMEGEVPDLEEIEEMSDMDSSLEMGDQVEPEFERDITCECGAKYTIRKSPGVSGFKVVQHTGTETELAENMQNEFET